ncbi:MAG: hypothetical protein IJ412_11815 [Oscillospiraceae bacterium]|nr:hypothetical protein [Oscillospiraceae bacterium]
MQPGFAALNLLRKLRKDCSRLQKAPQTKPAKIAEETANLPQESAEAVAVDADNREASPQQVGEITIIKNPYSGSKMLPQYANSPQRKVVNIENKSVKKAVENIAPTNNESQRFKKD